MTYLIMEAWLSSFPMITISLVYSFSGMNDSFMNGVGVPSVKCQISANIFPNITFSATYLILLRKPGYPAFPWSQYHLCTVSMWWMTASWMEALVANIFPNITSVQTLDNVTRCIAQSSLPSSHLSSHSFKSFFCSDIDHNDHYYHDPYSDMPHLSLCG